MSGWTFTTIEPADTVLDNEEALLDIQNDVEEAANSVLMNNPRTLDDEDIENVKRRLDELKRAINYDSENLVDEFLESEARDGLAEYPEHTALLGKRGLAEETSDSWRLANKIASEIGYSCVNRILFISSNDTSMSGIGILYDVKEDDIQRVDQWQGYHGCLGRDVEGYFLEEYGIKGRGGR